MGEFALHRFFSSAYALLGSPKGPDSTGLVYWAYKTSILGAFRKKREGRPGGLQLGPPRKSDPPRA